MRLHRLKVVGWRAALAAAIVFAMIVGSFSWWLNQPYPVVTTSQEWTRTTSPLPQRVGTVVGWTKPKVCVPAGVTRSFIYASADFPGGQFSTLLTDRKFTLDEGYCGEPNRTAIIIPSNLPNGSYFITIEACTDNPTPRDRCVTTTGPGFTVIGQPDVELPTQVRR